LLQGFKGLAQFASGPHRGDADAGGFPVKKGADFVDGFFLEVEEADDHLFLGFQGSEEFFEDFVGQAGGAFDGSRGIGVETFGFPEKLRLLGVEFRETHHFPGILAPEAVVAGVDGNF